MFIAVGVDSISDSSVLVQAETIMFINNPKAIIELRFLIVSLFVHFAVQRIPPDRLTAIG